MQRDAREKAFPLFVRTRLVWIVWHFTKSSIAPWLLSSERRCNEAVIHSGPSTRYSSLDKEAQFNAVNYWQIIADEKLTAFLELERITRESLRFLNAD
jgi:hypothetical protein